MKKLFVVLVAMLLLAITACSSGGGSSIGSSGGTVQITDKNSPIYGTQVVVPSGAIKSGQTVNITISYQDQLPGPIQSDFMQASKVIILTKDTSDNFIKPVSVTIPYSDAQMKPGDIPAVFYWDTTYNNYQPLAITNLDRSNKRVTFVTVHFTKFVALFIPDILTKILDLEVDTGFRPIQDGFIHDNYGAYFHPGGFCYGMAAYSIWYYSNKKSATVPGLYNTYRQEDPTDPLTPSIPWVDDVTAREVIARAHMNSYDVNIDGVVKLSQTNLSQEDVGLLLISAMKQTGQPQILHATVQSIDSKGNPVTGLHAVTVYKYDNNTEKFYIYDSNYPAGEVTVQWDLKNGFYDYDSNDYTIIKYGFYAISSFSNPVSFEPIYQKAASGGWSSEESVFKTINISLPQLDAACYAITQKQDGTNTDENVNGTLTNGYSNLEVPEPLSLIYYVNGVRQTDIAVDSTGSFTIPATSLTQQNNILDLFAATSSDEWDTYAGFKVATLSKNLLTLTIPERGNGVNAYVIFKDCTGAPIANALVTFATACIGDVPYGGVVFTPPTVMTDVNGTASVMVTRVQPEYDGCQQMIKASAIVRGNTITSNVAMMSP